eukprot:CAMPEP_0197888946 /NCGR_PEP_ID=MMETSP1439-20131203/22679_1 /TAXON_ID=66791 /ORGANISM="Gonyaulax spinifera, Strain CCMP409" /LENGTH=56 /DNA_ID=CAMNT_0043508879 /DNA_START=51 /DNA_END=218 /DNA_ORIENTATION=+
MAAGQWGPKVPFDRSTTTLMIRSLPRTYTSEALMCEIGRVCPEDSIDFMYLPWDND